MYANKCMVIGPWEVICSKLLNFSKRNFVESFSSRLVKMRHRQALPSRIHCILQSCSQHKTYKLLLVRYFCVLYLSVYVKCEIGYIKEG